MTLSPAELDEWDRRTSPERDPDEGLLDPVWRLANLYSVKDDNGDIVPFVPTDEQRLVIWAIHVLGWQRIIIPKARQLGMSLVLCLIGMDLAAWNEGWKSALIDKSEDDAKKKLAEKAKLGWESIPAEMRSAVSVTSTTTRIAWGAGESESSYEADVGFRGGTVQFLHISEWGEVQVTQRAKSKEIRDGSLPAVERAHEGICVVETTWKGGRDDGELGPLVKQALETPEDARGPKTWRLLFFPWQSMAAYRSERGYIDEESGEYFEQLQREHGISLTREQRYWYASKRRELGTSSMRSQYPTVLSECWETTVEGSIYGSRIDKARLENRVLDFLPDAKWPVWTFWDIGHPLNTVTWCAQITPAEIRLLDCLMDLDITFPDRVAILRAKGYTFGGHFFPHDAGIRQTGGLSQMDGFRESLKGLGPCHIVPRTHDTWHGIELLQGLFPRLVFHKTRCAKALEYLGRYHAITETSTGLARNEPVHDKHSHVADALRQMAQAIDGKMIAGAASVGGAGVTGRPTQSRVQVVRARPRI